MSYKLIQISQDMELYVKILKTYVERFDICSGEVSFLDTFGDKQTNRFILTDGETSAIITTNTSEKDCFSYFSPFNAKGKKESELDLIKKLYSFGVNCVYSDKAIKYYFADTQKFKYTSWSDDPIISIKNTIELKGGDYKRLRNIRNKYDRYVEEGKIIVQEVKEIDKETSKKMIDVIQSWRNNSKSFESQKEIYNTPENYVKEFNTINNNRDFMCICIFDSKENLLCYEMTELVFDKFINSCVGYKNYDIKTDLDVDGLNEYIMLTSVLYWFRRLRKLGLNVDDMALGRYGEGDALKNQKMKYRPYKIEKNMQNKEVKCLNHKKVMKNILKYVNIEVSNSLY
jgi:hypothetical protein